MSDPKNAEKITASMVSDGRLSATISQHTNTVTFLEDSRADNGPDKHVEGVCAAVEALLTKVR